MSHSTPVGQIQFEEADPHTPVNSQRRLVTPPPVSSKVQRSGLVHIIGKDPPKIPNLFGDFATIVPDDDSQEHNGTPANAWSKQTPAIAAAAAALRGVRDAQRFRRPLCLIIADNRAVRPRAYA